MAEYNELGQEVPNTRPVSVPIGWERPLSLHEQIKRFIRVEASLAAQRLEQETFEEADDFEVDEDPDPLSAYEIREAFVEAPGGEIDKDADPPPNPLENPPQEALKPSEG